MMLWLHSDPKTVAMGSLPYPENECQTSVNDFWSYILGNLIGNGLQTSISQVLAAFRGKNNNDTLPAPSWNRASMERQQFSVLHLG